MISINALVIDSDLKSRSNLIHAAKHEPLFKRVLPEASFRSALATIEQEDYLDVVFLSFQFDTTKLKEFILEAKQLPAAADCAVVLVVKQAQQTSNSVATNVINGADGFLFEPFSADSMREIAELSIEVSKKNRHERMSAAISVVMKDVLAQVDVCATAKFYEASYERTKRHLKQSCEFLTELGKEELELYYSLLIEMTSEIEVPLERRFASASSRVRKKVAKKIEASEEKKDIFMPSTKI